MLLLVRYDFSGKTIIPICTFRSSGMGSSAANLHSLVDDSVTWLDGSLMYGKDGINGKEDNA